MLSKTRQLLKEIKIRKRLLAAIIAEAIVAIYIIAAVVSSPFRYNNIRGRILDSALNAWCTNELDENSTSPNNEYEAKIYHIDCNALNHVNEIRLRKHSQWPIFGDEIIGGGTADLKFHWINNNLLEVDYDDRYPMYFNSYHNTFEGLTISYVGKTLSSH